MASSSPAGKVIYVEAKPTDGGVYKLIDGSWYCCLCSAFAPESHLWCRNHLWYVEQYRAGKLRPIQALEDMPAAWTAPPPRSAPPPPPRGQQTDGLSGHKPENQVGTRIQKPDTKTGVEPKQKLKAEVEPKKRNLETGKTGTPGERRNYF